jgi:putative FmdB family regulatory protein
MPTYEYACTKCGDRFDVYQSFSDEPLKKHASCGGRLSKVFGPVGIVLKGSGFYKTDNRSSSPANGAKKDSESASSESDSSSASSDPGSSPDSSSKSDSSASTSSDGKKSETSKKPEKKAAPAESKSA